MAADSYFSISGESGPERNLCAEGSFSLPKGFAKLCETAHLAWNRSDPGYSDANLSHML